MKIYLASSWRNEEQPRIVELLRNAGHEVYDFRNPPNKAGFQWAQIEEGWEAWTPREFVENLNHPDAVAGYNADYDAMKWADACVLLMPCGRSAHLEAGYFWGARKPLVIHLNSAEPELMYKCSTAFTFEDDDLLDALKRLEEERNKSGRWDPERCFLDGQFKDPETCPSSISTDDGSGRCRECRTALEPYYGFCGGYGIGASSICPECSTVHDFVADEGQ